MIINYKIQYKLDEYRAIDIEKTINVIGVVYETDNIICYKINNFETITLSKEKSLIDGKIYLIQ